MDFLPPFPNWEAAHPIVVHFPIALLLAAWVPVAIGLVDKPRRTGWMLAGLLALLGGTLMAFVAVMSGEATEDAALITTVAGERLVHEHEEMGELARNLFVMVTLLFGAVLGVGAAMKKGGARKATLTIGGVIVLALYAYAGSRLAWAGHMGGELVHGHGVRAPMDTGGGGSGAPASYPQEDEDDD